MPHNYSLYSIPAYYVLAMLPHIYSAITVSRNKQNWDIASPRSEKFSALLKKTLPPDALGKYERARAAHNNMLSENMAFFVGAVLAGNMAGLNAGFMNNITAGYLASRVVYLICYIYIRRQRYAVMRTVAFNVGCAILMWVYVKAAGSFAVKVSL
jgi:uncharacterized MAPEG superfamily protein